MNNNVYVLMSNGGIREWGSDGVGGGIQFHSGSFFSEALAFFAVANPVAIEMLISQVENVARLNSGQKRSLITKLEGAERSLGREAQYAAIGELNAFILEVGV